MPTPTNPTLTLADALAAIDAGMESVDCRHHDCVGVAEHDRVDEAYEALRNVKGLITHLATLLDGVLADDPQAIRDAALWLTVNRPAVDGGDTVGEGER